MTTRWRRAASLLVAAALAMAACGDDSSDTGSPGTPGDTGDAQSGGTLVFASYREAPSLDVIVDRQNAHPFIFDPLMRLDEDGSPVPYLAESMEPSEDFQTWTMTLRPDVLFHDGTPLDAEAVVYNIERHKDPDVGSAWDETVGQIESITAEDELTVVFELAEPLPPFPASFVDGLGWMASPTAVEEMGEEFARNPVGAGPFVFESWVIDSEMRLSKNPNYWQDGLPYLDEVIIRPIADHSSRLQSVLNDDADVGWFVTEPHILEAETYSDDLYVVGEFVNGGTGFVMNTNVAPFDDIRVRKALVMALNYDVISDVLFDGAMQPAQTNFAPSSAYYTDVSDIYPEFDPEGAKDLIEEYTADVGVPSFRITGSNSADRRTMAELFQGFWTDAGAEVEISLEEAATDRLRAGDFQLHLAGQRSFSEPHPRIYDSYHSEGLKNYGRYSNPDMDAEIDRARRSADPEVLKEAYAEIQRIMAEELMYPFFAHGRTALVARNEIQGVVAYADGSPLPATMWIDE